MYDDLDVDDVWFCAIFLCYVKPSLAVLPWPMSTQSSTKRSRMGPRAGRGVDLKCFEVDISVRDWRAACVCPTEMSPSACFNIASKSGSLNDAIAQIEQGKRAFYKSSTSVRIHFLFYTRCCTTLFASPALSIVSTSSSSVRLGNVIPMVHRRAPVRVATYVKSAQSKQQLETCTLRISPTVCVRFIQHVPSASRVCTVAVGRV